MIELDKDYWQTRWEKGQTGWDIGYASTPLVNYFDQLENKDQKILIPGAGNAYEGEYLHKNGFHNTYILDIAPGAINSLKARFPQVPNDRIIQGDFFDLQDEFDLIVEQTFFCALDPALRKAYVSKMLQLLKPGGILMGVLFHDELFKDHPPFGGYKEDYLPLFEKKFEILNFDIARDSIKPRQGRELFIELKKPI
jgi:SAM-dependent methyltransferase